MVKIPEHKDKLGVPLAVDSCVVYPEGNSLAIGKIVKLHPVMVKIRQLGKMNGWGNYESNKYPQDTVVIDSKNVSMYLLKQ